MILRDSGLDRFVRDPAKDTILLLLYGSDDGLVRDRTRPAVYCLNHPEYGPQRLLQEFARDRSTGRQIDPPVGYDAELRRPQVGWQAAARSLYRNWLTEIAAADPRTSADVALDWLLRAQLSGDTAPTGSPCRLQ